MVWTCVAGHVGNTSKIRCTYIKIPKSVTVSERNFVLTPVFEVNWWIVLFHQPPNSSNRAVCRWGGGIQESGILFIIWGLHPSWESIESIKHHRFAWWMLGKKNKFASPQSSKQNKSKCIQVKIRLNLCKITLMYSISTCLFTSNQQKNNCLSVTVMYRSFQSLKIDFRQDHAASRLWTFLRQTCRESVTCGKCPTGN